MTLPGYLQKNTERTVMDSNVTVNSGFSTTIVSGLTANPQQYVDTNEPAS